MDSSEAVCTKNVITCASCSTDNIPKGREREALGLLKCTQHWTANLTHFPSVATQTNADIHACHKSTYIKITKNRYNKKNREKAHAKKTVKTFLMLQSRISCLPGLPKQIVNQMCEVCAPASLTLSADDASAPQLSEIKREWTDGEKQEKWRMKKDIKINERISSVQNVKCDIIYSPSGHFKLFFTEVILNNILIGLLNAVTMNEDQ